MMKKLLRLVLPVLLALGSQAASAQIFQDIYADLSTFQEQSVTYTFQSVNDVNVDQPDHGTVEVVLLDPNGSLRQLTYTPDPGYLGQDYVEIKAAFSTSPPGMFNHYLTIDISETIVIANQDFAYATADTPIDIDVLANDESSLNQLEVVALPVVNGGSAVSNGVNASVTFTPAPGFEGLTYFNYTVCDPVGTCDVGTVNVMVTDNNLPDTTIIYTKRNHPTFVIVPPSFVQVGGPDNGTYDDSGFVPKYYPNNNFVGDDYITYDDQGDVHVVNIVVLPYYPNAFAKDDIVYVSPGETIEINLFANDLYGDQQECFSVDPADNGTVDYDGQTEGVVTYTAPTDFLGEDHFTYSARPPQCLGNTETADVIVRVGNYEPVQAKYQLSTPKLTPLVIGNNIPISNYSITITDQPQMGVVFLIENDTTLYGQYIAADNALIYIPADSVDQGLDQFEAEFCTLSGTDCGFQKTVKFEVEILDIGDGIDPMCFGDCVWPGDANNDGIVHVSDLLPIGLAMGEVGQARDDSDLSNWYGQYGDDWQNATLGFDLKYADTNGDSIISSQDTFAIKEFYGKTHSITSNIPASSEYEFVYDEVTQGPYSAGDLVVVDLLLGHEGQPIVDLYGFHFGIDYNPDIFESSSFQVTYPGSWMTYNSPVLDLDHNDLEGKYETAFTRTNGLSASGFGQVATLSFIVIEDLDGIKGEVEEFIGGSTGVLVNGGGQSTGITLPDLSIIIGNGGQVTSTEEEIVRADQLQVYPNPAHSELHLHFNGGHQFQEVSIFDLSGRLVYQNRTVGTRHEVVDVSNLHAGFYVARAVTDAGVVQKKFEVLR